MDEGNELDGGCLCGAVRYRVTVMPADVADFCHCSQCRKSTGAPVAAWVQVPPERFRVMRGQARSYRSSPRAERWFCGDCGSPLYMTDPDGRSIGILLGTLDEPGRVTPTVHGWVSARLSWLPIDASLPRFPYDPPYDL